MDILKHRPNLLFLINVRKPSIGLITLTRLKEPLYHKKLLKAITTRRVRQIEGCTKTIWEVNKKPHREDGPASLCEHGERWIINGKYHRIDHPAVISYLNNGSESKEWWIHGRRHRHKVNGVHLPAFIVYEGEIIREEWYWNGMRHRGKVNGVQLPAIVDNGTSHSPQKNYAWYWHDRLHRVDGPANIIGELENPSHYTWSFKGLLHHPNSDPKGLENPATKSIFSGYDTNEWWYNGDLQQARIDNIILLVTGEDITVDLTNISKPMVKIVNSYCNLLKKVMYKMSDIKDKQELALLRNSKK